MGRRARYRSSHVRLLLDVSKAADGSLAGELTSVDQGGVRIPIARIQVSGNAMHFDVNAVGGNFDGSIGDDKSRITGTWRQGISLPLEFIRTSTAK
jgi:hypothetical protein